MSARTSTSDAIALISPKEAARRLGLSRATFDQRLKDGTLYRLGLVEANRISRLRKFDAASIERVLWARTQAAR